MSKPEGSLESTKPLDQRPLICLRLLIGCDGVDNPPQLAAKLRENVGAARVAGLVDPLIGVGRAAQGGLLTSRPEPNRRQSSVEGIPGDGCPH